jgi:Family of unknown function (DUF6498)
MKRQLLRLLQLLGINGVPAFGLFGAGWSPATVLALYWWETLITSLLLGLLIARHRRLTRKRGHYREQLQVAVTVQSGTGEKRPHKFGSFLSEFLTVSLFFTFVHGVFLAFILFMIGTAENGLGVDRGALETAVPAIALLAVLGFAIDLIGVGDRPFGWLRKRSEGVIGRVMLIQLTIILGMVFMAARDKPMGFFSVFLGLKLMADIGAYLPQWNPKEPPGCLTGVMNRIGRGDGGPKGEDFAAYWKRTDSEKAAREDKDEEVVDPKSLRKREPRGRRKR